MLRAGRPPWLLSEPVGAAGSVEIGSYADLRSVLLVADSSNSEIAARSPVLALTMSGNGFRIDADLQRAAADGTPGFVVAFPETAAAKAWQPPDPPPQAGASGAGHDPDELWSSVLALIYTGQASRAWGLLDEVAAGKPEQAEAVRDRTIQILRRLLDSPYIADLLRLNGPALLVPLQQRPLDPALLGLTSGDLAAMRHQVERAGFQGTGGWSWQFQARPDTGLSSVVLLHRVRNRVLSDLILLDGEARILFAGTLRGNDLRLEGTPVSLDADPEIHIADGLGEHRLSISRPGL